MRVKFSKTDETSKQSNGILQIPQRYLIFDPFLESKLLSSLWNDQPYLQAVSECLDTTLAGAGNYRVVAQNYGMDHYLVAVGLEKEPNGPTTALLEWLSATRPNLTVQEFAAVVIEKAERRDVAAVLVVFMYEADDSKRLNRVADAGKQLKSCNNIMHRFINTSITSKFLTPKLIFTLNINIA